MKLVNMLNTLHKECALLSNPLKSPFLNGGTHLTSHTIHPMQGNPAFGSSLVPGTRAQ
jgi:hypothetical protein